MGRRYIDRSRPRATHCVPSLKERIEANRLDFSSGRRKAVADSASTNWAPPYSTHGGRINSEIRLPIWKPTAGSRKRTCLVTKSRSALLGITTGTGPTNLRTLQRALSGNSGCDGWPMFMTAKVLFGNELSAYDGRERKFIYGRGLPDWGQPSPQRPRHRV